MLTVESSTLSKNSGMLFMNATNYTTVYVTRTAAKDFGFATVQTITARSA